MENAEDNPTQPETPSSGNKERSSRRRAMTPEMRKFLGPGRSWHDREASKEEAEEFEEAPPPTSQPTSEPPSRKQWEPRPPESIRDYDTDFDEPKPPAPAVMPNHDLSRVMEMQKVVLTIGALLALGVSFYLGTRAGHLKNLLGRQNEPEFTGIESNKFRDVPTDELVEQALVAEQSGRWHEAVERLVAAQQQTSAYRGLFFRAGKLCYDHDDFDTAERVLERAVGSGDHPGEANHLRGLIAARRNDFPAAERFFEAAIDADPFAPAYYYDWGEALRRDHRPNDAIKRYEQSAMRNANERDKILCRFKARLAKVETADNAQLEAEFERKRADGPLTVDWLLTSAALRIRAGQIGEAAQVIKEARNADQPGRLSLFAACTSDMLFGEASRNYPEIAAACRVDTNASASAP